MNYSPTPWMAAAITVYCLTAMLSACVSAQITPNIEVPRVVMRPFRDPVQAAAEWQPPAYPDTSVRTPKVVTQPLRTPLTDKSDTAADASNSWRQNKKTVASQQCEPGEPLMLTPLIDSGRVSEARSAARVDLPDLFDAADLLSYSGYITVNRTDNSSTFFWFFVAKDAANLAPLIMWLQGGPGQSSLLGALVENGPVSVDALGRLSEREHSWTRFANMLYVDNPFGAGYSFAGSPASHVTSEAQMAQNMYEFLRQFFTLFPELNCGACQFYITGESYAGKYIPYLAQKILKENHNKNTPPTSKQLIMPLSGMAIGNGWISPEHMLPGMADLMFNLGLIDEHNAQFATNFTDGLMTLIRAGRFRDARYSTAEFSRIFYNLTGATNFYNILLAQSPAQLVGYQKYITSCATRRALHAGNLAYNSHYTNNNAVQEYLADDIMRSAAPTMVELSNAGVRTLIYNGQLDVLCGPALAERMLSELGDGWKFAQDFRTSPKILWKLNKTDVEVAGYVRNLNDTFYAVTVRGAGHMAPMDQPERAFDMIKRFVRSLPFK